MIKSDLEFQNMLQDIRNERAFKKLDPKPVSFQELTFRMTRFEPLWEVLKKAKFVKDKKGQINVSEFNIFTIGIVALLTVVLFGGMIFTMGLLNDTFMDIGQTNTIKGVNLTKAAEDTFGQVNDSIQALRLVAVTLIFAEIMFLIIFTGFSRKHPALWFVWILLVFLAIMLAAPISNAYESLLQSNIYDGNLASFTGANWILLHLPFVILLTGILGGILMFVNIVRDSQQEGLGI